MDERRRETGPMGRAQTPWYDMYVCTLHYSSRLSVCVCGRFFKRKNNCFFGVGGLHEKRKLRATQHQRNGMAHRQNVQTQENEGAVRRVVLLLWWWWAACSGWIQRYALRSRMVVRQVGQDCLVHPVCQIQDSSDFHF